MIAQITGGKKKRRRKREEFEFQENYQEDLLKVVEKIQLALLNGNSVENNDQ